MRLEEHPDERLTLYFTDGLLDRLALNRIPNLRRVRVALRPDVVVYARKWDEWDSSARVWSVWARVWVGDSRGKVVKAEVEIDGPPPPRDHMDAPFR